MESSVIAYGCFYSMVESRARGKPQRSKNRNAAESNAQNASRRQTVCELRKLYFKQPWHENRLANRLAIVNRRDAGSAYLNSKVMAPDQVGTSRCDVPARVPAGGTIAFGHPIAPLNAVRTAQRRLSQNSFLNHRIYLAVHQNAP
jgi:hypothetical protein